jgi:hypothetical protein
MGFRESENWAQLMAASLVTNFFVAVHRGEMEFDVADGRFLINRNTVGGLLEDTAIKAAAESAGHAAELEFAAQLYRCLLSPLSEVASFQVAGLGTMSVRVLVDTGLPRRIAFVRNGMLITDNLHNFGHPFARFPGSRDFVALVEPEDVEAQKLIKQLENPAHSELSAQRIPDPMKRLAAEKAMKALGRKLRELIRSTTGVQVQGTVVIDELARFFADPGAADAPTDENAERNPETFTFEPPRVITKRPVRPARNQGKDGGRAGTGDGTGGSAGGTGTGVGGGSGGRGERGRATPVELREVRNVIPGNRNGAARSRLLHFTPTIDGEIRIEVDATGLNSAERLDIQSADQGVVSDGTVKLATRAGERLSVLVSFTEAYEGPVEVSATSATVEAPV